MSETEPSGQDSATRPESAPSGWWHLLPAILVVAIGLGLYAWDFRFFWVGDYQLWFAPMFEEVTRAFREGDWPILTQGTWASGNLAGEYQCGTFSLAFNAILFAVWNLPLTIHAKAAALSFVFLALLTTGVSLLARRRGLAPAYSTLVSLVAAYNGWIIVWAATDWFGALAGFVWVPWLWWSLEAAGDEDARLRRWVLPGLFAYFLISAGNPYAIVMGVLVGLRELVGALFCRRWRQIAALIFAGIVGTGLSAPSWLALVELLHGSQRETWGGMAHHSWKVPWLAWSGILLPAFETKWNAFFHTWQWHVSVEMVGALVPAIACIAATLGTGGRYLKRHWGDLLFLAAIVGLASAPGFGSFRWSFRLLPLFFLVLGLLGAAALSELKPRTPALLALLASASMWSIASLTGTCSDHRFAHAQTIIVGLWLAASIVSSPRISAWLGSATTVALVFMGFTFLPTTQKVSRHKFQQNLMDPTPLDRDRLYLSVHNFLDIISETAAKPGFGSVLRPCNTAQLAGLHFVNGYSSFTSDGLPMLFETHGSFEPEKAELILRPESERLLDLLGVDGLCISTRFLPAADQLKDGWQLVHIAEEGQVYHRWPRRATPCKALDSVFDRKDESFATPTVEIVRAGRNKVTVKIGDSDSTKPIALAFPRPWFNGYEATLNGKPVPTRPYLKFIPLVELPPGSIGIVELRYWPKFLRIGLPVAGGTALLLLVAGIISRTFRKR